MARSMLYKLVAVLALCAVALGARDLKAMQTASLSSFAPAPAPQALAGGLKFGGFGAQLPRHPCCPHR